MERRCLKVFLEIRCISNAVVGITASAAVVEAATFVIGVDVINAGVGDIIGCKVGVVIVGVLVGAAVTIVVGGGIKVVVVIVVIVIISIIISNGVAAISATAIDAVRVRYPLSLISESFVFALASYMASDVVPAWASHIHLCPRNVN